jgi:hypothetical protein
MTKKNLSDPTCEHTNKLLFYLFFPSLFIFLADFIQFYLLIFYLFWIGINNVFWFNICVYIIVLNKHFDI